MGFLKKLLGIAADENETYSEAKKTLETSFYDEDGPKIKLGHLENGILTMTESITELDDESLEEYKHLRKIVFPTSLTKLESTVIDDQEQLEEVDFSKVTNLRKIPEDFISGKHKIRQFIIPMGVQTVEDGFIGEAKAGTEIFVPASVGKLGYFNGNCDNDLVVYLFAADVDIEEAEEDIKTLYVLPQYYTQYAKQLKKCDSEAQLREIPEDKRNFYKSIRTHSEQIVDEKPNRVTESSNNQQTNVTRPLNTKLMEQQKKGHVVDIEGKTYAIRQTQDLIGSIDINDSKMIRKMVLPSSLIRIPQSIFSYHEKLKEVDFSQCSSLIVIDSFAFRRCEQLEEVDLSQCSSLTEIGNYAFDDCKQLKKLVLPSSIISIAEKAFRGCEQLKKVVLPSSITRIAENAFQGCEQLEEVDFSQCSSLTEIGDVVSGCTQLKKVILPSSITRIAEYAFRGCEQLEEVDFSQCSSLTEIGDGTFSGCEQLKKVVLPSSIIKIGDSAFSGCEQLTSVILPDILVEIGRYAFERTCLTEIVIPDSVEHIGSGAFERCEQLTRATIGLSAKDYFDERYPIFKNTPNLKELTFCSEVAEYTGAKALTKVTFCDTVKELGKWAVAECEELEEVVIPDSVTKIGYGAFVACTNLSSIVLSDNITEMAESVLAKTRVKEIVFPRELRKLGVLGKDYEKLRKLDFSKVTNLKTIPENFIGSNTPKLKEIALPVGVAKIEECIGGENLSRIFLPSTIKEVEELHQVNIDIYCFSPVIEELELMVDGIEDEEDAIRLHVLPEYLDSYIEQRDAERIPKNILIIDVIPEEFRYYYDN
ncbi:MAG: leucine-rich repeat protein [Prevotella sp.]|nr:leucine-rich repeat protein [Prevotella sp.]